MNWGNSIVIVFVVFAVIMISMVTICMKQDDLHLVTQHYYEEEIKYQEHIDRVINASTLNLTALAYDRDKKTMTLDLPIGAVGSLHFFRPSDARLDQILAVNMDQEKGIQVDVKGLKPGYWRVKLNWTASGKEYFQELKINI
ncbi:FixH family protein [Pararhodonellum marinum]|uniref:FixH family protein n=1 Tax=Pararhodonellum marinum TaxID=2755358 RepID=UPI00188F77DF|nr:FixH family protein [Pararhodonellum marinum]